jgi:hypothetical protein
MFIDTRAYSLRGNEFAFRMKEIPDTCPICHRAVHAQQPRLDFLEGRKIVQVVFRCTHLKCQELFIGTYRDTGTTESGRRCFQLNKIAPRNPKKETFSETIREVSSSFINIYNQSLAAESANLGQLVGIGLRKALEFLVKDFSILKNPDKEEKIKVEPLGKCINTYIEDINVKECAKRAAWLGNDETHYLRKWDDRDIEDLKLLIRLTVNWIENVILTEKYITEMEDKRT